MVRSVTCSIEPRTWNICSHGLSRFFGHGPTVTFSNKPVQRAPSAGRKTFQSPDSSSTVSGSQPSWFDHAHMHCYVSL